jgi:hypothetical protein
MNRELGRRLTTEWHSPQDEQVKVRCSLQGWAALAHGAEGKVQCVHDGLGSGDFDGQPGRRADAEGIGKQQAEKPENYAAAALGGLGWRGSEVALKVRFIHAARLASGRPIPVIEKLPRLIEKFEEGLILPARMPSGGCERAVKPQGGGTELSHERTQRAQKVLTTDEHEGTGMRDPSMIVRGRERLGVDAVEGVGGYPSNDGVRIGQSNVGQRWDCGGRLSLECPEGVCREIPDCGVRAFESGSKGEHGGLRRGLELAQNDDCLSLVGEFVRRIEASGDHRHNLICGLSELGNPADGFECYEVSGVMGVCNSRQEKGESIGPEAGQGPCDRDSTIWPVCIIHKPTQIVEGRHCAWPEDAEGKFGSVGECWIVKHAGELLGRSESGSNEPGDKRSLPAGRVKLNPFYEEWECCRADMVNSVCCPLQIRGRGAGRAHERNPVTEEVAVVGGFETGRPVCEKGNEAEAHRNDEDEEGSPLSHSGDYAKGGGR